MQGLNPAKNWSQGYTYDNLHRLAKAEQGQMDGWPSNPSINSSGKLSWTWDDFAENGPELDKLGNWVNFSNNGTLGSPSYFVRPWYNPPITFYSTGMQP
jgi:hypothetical protein